MRTLQNAMVTTPVLVRINYSLDAGEIVVRADVSLDGFSGYLGQRDLKSRKV